MRGDNLTDRQHEVLEHIREHLRRWGLPPSRSELTRSLGVASATAVNHHLQALQRKGWIQLNPGKDRGIQLLREGTPVFDVNTLPTVPAGTPALADESAAVVRVPDNVSQLIHPEADFYVTVEGDSMDRVGYRSGDIVAVKRNPDPGEGQVVIARIGHEITLKCFHRAGRNRIELQPRSSNPEHNPIVIDGTTGDWEIVGVVVGAMIGARPTTGC
ncbi:MAG: transcriptional repressor LexA [Acidobacteriota bacterium]|nr:transcriptional repressor LexA [Acidobacteriota bacterium]